MRFDIAFFLCCCRSFLKNGRDETESYYELLGVESNASPDELKRAYKRQSLQMHPDKIAQKGKTVTSHDRDRFTRMRHAYEVLSDPRRRETYDAIGERGMKFVEEPLSVDPQELAHNFATSSILDRSKIFAIFLSIYIAVFLLPVMVCLMIDGSLSKSGAKWVAVLTPLWVWDVIILFYHSRIIMMGPIKRPDHIPEEEWVDPLPMWKRLMSMFRFTLLMLFEVLTAIRLDGFIHPPWSVIFIPIYLWETIALRKKIILAHIRIVTHDELELIIGKKFFDCTTSEKEEIHRRFIVVPTKEGSIYEAARRLRSEAKSDVIRILARLLFTVLLVINLDSDVDWSWWLVFLPILCMSVCIVGSAFRNFAQTQAEAAKRDPRTFGPAKASDKDEEQSSPSGAQSSTPYSKMGGGEKPEPLTDDERDELKAKVMHSAYRAVGTCFSQCFFLFLLCLLIGKIEGAGYSSLVIISPFMAFGGIILCCLACTIFCISEVDENAGMVDFDSAVAAAAAAAAGNGFSSDSSATQYTPPMEMRGNMPQNSTDTDPTAGAASGSKPQPSSIWDPERGQVWQDPKHNQTNLAPPAEEKPLADEKIESQLESEENNDVAVVVPKNDSYDLD